jgi:hypothetical protein
VLLPSSSSSSEDSALSSRSLSYIGDLLKQTPENGMNTVMQYNHFSYNAIDLSEKSVSIMWVHVGYYAIKIKHMKKFNFSSIFENKNIFSWFMFPEFKLKI